jgi:hypothetical protein
MRSPEWTFSRALNNRPVPVRALAEEIQTAAGRHSVWAGGSRGGSWLSGATPRFKSSKPLHPQVIQTRRFPLPLLPLPLLPVMAAIRRVDLKTKRMTNHTVVQKSITNR